MACHLVQNKKWIVLHTTPQSELEMCHPARILGSPHWAKLCPATLAGCKEHKQINFIPIDFFLPIVL